MSMLLWAAAIGAGWWLFGKRRHDWPPGQAPTDDWPRDLLARATRSEQTGDSGVEYLVISTPPGRNDRALHAAVAKDRDEWISYVHDRGTGERELYRVFAPTDAAATRLRADWGLA